MTKKGVLIVNWEYDYPIIRKAKFIKEDSGDKNDICYFEFNNDVLAVGDKDVKKILNGINGNFIEKEEHFFYIINVKIKGLDTFFSASVKEKICFVDLPGYGTGNKFETKDIYSKFIKSCKLFVLVAKDNFSEGQNINNINSLLVKTSDFQKISPTALCKKILFVINNFSDIPISEDLLVNKKKLLVENIQSLKKADTKDIDMCFINGGFYQKYLEFKQYFSNLDFLFRFENFSYLKDRDNFQKGYRQRVASNFESYLFQKLIDKLKEIYSKDLSDIESIEIDKEINDTIDSIIAKKKYDFDEEDLADIKKIITYCKYNIDQSDYMKKSNYIYFKSCLAFSINRIEYISNDEFKDLIRKNLDDLDKIFDNQTDKKDGKSLYKKITNDAKNKLELFNLKSERQIDKIKLEKQNNDVPAALKESISQIISALKNLKNNIDDKLKKKIKWKDIQDEFEKTFSSKIEQEKNETVSKLEKCSDNINNFIIEAYGLIDEYKEEKTTPEKIKEKFGELKTKISNQLGEKTDYKKAFDDIVDDIINNSKNVTDWKHSSGLLDYLKGKLSDKIYLNKTIDFIIINSEERLNNFKDNISDLIDKYIADVIISIDIENKNIKKNLETIKKEEELQNEKAIQELAILNQQNQEIKAKKGKLSPQYKQLKTSIENLVKNTETLESQLIEGESETPNP